MSKPMGLMIRIFNYAKAPNDEFHDWYDLEHIPERLAIKGFINAERWIGADDPNIAAATYDLDNIDVLKSKAYLAHSGENLSPWSKRVTSMCERIGRFDMEQILPGREVAPQNAGGMLIFATNILPEAEVEYNAWYDEEHIPRLRAVPGVLCARRFKTVSGIHKYFAVYHLSSTEVQASEAWTEAVTTPWRTKVNQFTRDRLRFVLKRYKRSG